MEDNKSPVLIAMLDDLSGKMAKAQGKGMTRSQALRTNCCASCGGSATQFRDDCSKREYQLTAWCQTCQDATFGVSDDD